MFSFTKMGATLVGIFLLAPAVFAQNKTVIIKYLNPTQNVRKTLQSMTRVPSKYARVNELAQMRRMNFQNAVLDGIDMGIERQAVAIAQAHHQSLQTDPAPTPNKNLQAQAQLSPEQLQAKAQKTIHFLADYLAANANVWPVYAPHTQAANLLKRIANFMEVENPSLDVLYIQREIIRLRAASQARSPQEVLAIVKDMMHYGMVPSRAYLSEETGHTQEELEIGEELAFAIAASKVPMEANPWKNLQMQEVADKTAVYHAMRRTDPLFEGLPEFYVKDGIHKSNFPVWTRGEYAWHQHKWAHEHPFEYALAPYWENTFGQALYRVYSHLSDVEKQAILFTAPGLPQVADTTAENFAPYYDKELENWIAAHNHAPRSRVKIEQEERLGNKLAYPQQNQGTYISFKNAQGQYVAFSDLGYPQQLEVLLWIWQKYQIFPQQALEIIGK